MYGVVTRNEEEVTWTEFDVAFFEMKDVTGRATTPVEAGTNMVSCFADNAAVTGDPSLAPVSETGKRATRERRQFDWDYVCPTDDTYREGVLEMVSDAAAVNDDVRLNDIGFPRGEYCHCDRCTRLFEASDHDDRVRWRQQVVTEFVAEARERVPGDLYLTVYPDPYPGHLEQRSGVNVDALAPYADEFVVPIYDTAYATTYWVEALAMGFRDRLPEPFSIELYAINIDLDRLVETTQVAGAYADRVLFGYQAGNGRAVIRRLRADERDGVSFGPDGDDP